MNAALLLKLSEFDTMYKLINGILKGAKVLSPDDVDNIKKGCSNIKSKISLDLRGTINVNKNQDTLKTIIENIIKKHGYQIGSLKDAYVLILILISLLSIRF